MTSAGVYIPPPLTCTHGRQTVHCAECAPAAEARFARYRVEFAELEKKMSAAGELILQAREGIREASKGKVGSGSIICPACLGTLRYRVVKAGRGRSTAIRAKCQTPDCMEWME